MTKAKKPSAKTTKSIATKKITQKTTSAGIPVVGLLLVLVGSGLWLLSEKVSFLLIPSMVANLMGAAVIGASIAVVKQRDRK